MAQDAGEHFPIDRTWDADCAGYRSGKRGQPDVLRRTSGDNAVHLITKQTDGSYKDVTTPIAPKLPDVNGNIVTPNLLVQKPRKSTS